MKLTLWKKLAAILTLGLFAQFAHAQFAVSTVANILAQMEHNPTEHHRTLLTGIVSNPGNGEGPIALARAVLEFNHRLTDENREVVAALAEDESQDENLRQVAAILLEYEHMATEEQKEKLEEIGYDRHLDI